MPHLQLGVGSFQRENGILSFNNFNIKDRLVYGRTVFILLILHQIKRETENNIKTGTQNLPVMLSRSSTPVSQVYALAFWMKMLLHNFDLEQIKASVQIKCHSHNSLTPYSKSSRGFLPSLWSQKLFWFCRGFLSPLNVPTFTHLGCTTADKRERELSGQCMAGAGSIVPPSIEITEQISGVCIFAVFGGGPTFGVMNRSLAFFCRSGGSVTALSKTCMLEEEEREQLNHSPSSLGWLTPLSSYGKGEGKQRERGRRRAHT